MPPIYYIHGRRFVYKYAWIYDFKITIRTTQQCCEVSSLWGKVSAILAFHNHLSYFGWQKDHIVNVSIREELLIYENLLRTNSFATIFCAQILISQTQCEIPIQLSCVQQQWCYAM